MARVRITTTNATPETSIVFYPAGGHNHNGISSSLIDTSKYSIFDFNPGPVGNDTTRRTIQDNNFISFKNFIITTVNESVLAPAGVVLGSNTVGADNIKTNSITAAELTANLVLINNVIQSNSYVFGSQGWRIAANGDAEFNNVTVRGNVFANSGVIGGWNIDSLTGIYTSDGSVILQPSGYFTIGSNVLNQATITNDGDFTVIGPIGAGYGVSRFFGPWFKVVIGTNINANASTAAQSQLTWDSLRIADAGNTSTYTSYISMENPSASESYFAIVKNSNTEVYISNTVVTASNAVAGFSSLVTVSSIAAGSYISAGTYLTTPQIRTAYWADPAGANRVVLSYSDTLAYGGTTSQAYIVVHNQGGGLLDSLHSWTGGHWARWDAGPNPKYRIGMVRDAWGAYIEYQYAGGIVYLNGTFVNASDERLKTNIRTLSNSIDSLSIVNKIEPKIFELNSSKTKKLLDDGSISDEYDDAPDNFGFIAQDFLEPLAEYSNDFVKTVKNEDYNFDIYTLNDRALIAVLWQAVREINVRLQNIENGV